MTARPLYKFILIQLFSLSVFALCCYALLVVSCVVATYEVTPMISHDIHGKLVLFQHAPLSGWCVAHLVKWSRRNNMLTLLSVYHWSGIPCEAEHIRWVTWPSATDSLTHIQNDLAMPTRLSAFIPFIMTWSQSYFSLLLWNFLAQISTSDLVKCHWDDRSIWDIYVHYFMLAVKAAHLAIVVMVCFFHKIEHHQWVIKPPFIS